LQKFFLRCSRQKKKGGGGNRLYFLFLERREGGKRRDQFEYSLPRGRGGGTPPFIRINKGGGKLSTRVGLPRRGRKEGGGFFSFHEEAKGDCNNLDRRPQEKVFKPNTGLALGREISLLDQRKEGKRFFARLSILE